MSTYEPQGPCRDCGEAHAWWDHGRVKDFGEDPIEPYFDEHLSADGEWITTRGQRRAIMDKKNFDYRKTGKVKYGTVMYFDRKSR